jgi:hypothetical protein
MNWKPWTYETHVGRLNIDWCSLPNKDKDIDPYLIWGDVSGFGGSLIEDDPSADTESLWFRLALEIGSQIGIDLEHSCTVFDGATTGYLTAMAKRAQIASILEMRGVRRAELGYVSRRKEPPAPGPGKPKPIYGPVIGVIDFGCAFAHERFRAWDKEGSWKSRIEYLWDQGTEAPCDDPLSVWGKPAGQRYGRELTAKGIERLLKDNMPRGSTTVDEDALYLSAGYGDATLRLMHGTHVLDLAAGADPLSAIDEKAPSIIFVQLPAYAVDDTSGGSMVTHVLDALRYMLDRVKGDAPLVVNLSYGSMAGPHDGTTILESAMDAILASESKRRCMAIVLPAGNNFEADGHAKMKLGGPDPRKQELLWEVRCDDPTDTFMEVWFPRKHASNLEIRVQPPGGPQQCVNSGELYVLHDDQDRPIGTVIHREHVASGLRDAMALVALCPTTPERPHVEAAVHKRPVVPPGVWRVEVSLAEDVKEAIEVNAWIERDDPPIGSGAPPRQSRFLRDDSPLRPNVNSPQDDIVQRAGTCNSIANGSLTVVVGACLAGRDDDDPQMSRYSSAGPTRNKERKKPWPNLVAPGDQSSSLLGVLGAGTRSGARLRMNGTSVAAPQVARDLIRQYATATLTPGGFAVDPVTDPKFKERAGVGKLKT